MTNPVDEIQENKKSEVAQQKLRDEHGHFITAQESKKDDKVTNFFKNNTKVSKGHSDDKLIDLEVGNPLQKITELLEDIKQQKAFSFTLKGSLGITGVVLSLSLLGLFGTQHVLCDKGTQSHMGTIKILQVTDEDPDSFMTKVGNAIDYYKYLFNPNYERSQSKQRVVLLTSENGIIKVEANKSLKIDSWEGQQVIVTGNYDTCTKTINPKIPNAIEGVI